MSGSHGNGHIPFGQGEKVAGGFLTSDISPFHMLTYQYFKYWSLEETVLLPRLAVLLLLGIMSWKKRNKTKMKFEAGGGLGCWRDGQSLGWGWVSEGVRSLYLESY